MECPIKRSSRIRNHSFRLAILPVALICVSFSSCAKSGQRLINFEVKVDDKIALTGKRGVPDTMPVEKMWDVADDVSFEISKDYFDAVGTSLEDSTTHEVKGNIVVRIRHVNSELASSSVSTLKFKKVDADSWSLSDGEKDLLKQASSR